MENLNDVEFGSEKSEEEAPILVAQRYLNIFRQVHIFNKAKRDEFDDELLALPQNITEFFKRMPGGRLLVEHIEEVKAARGIAFVKSNSSDFDEGAGKTDSPVAAGGAVHAVGGTLTLDASFADKLAQSLANAFKQLPQNANPVRSGAPVVSADFGNAFDVIADEIRTSRASLLDVLKETRSITDSVIASQVSISRILEGILSSRNRDEADTADLNNRIIASQASITKLLEGLYTANNKKNNEISDYLNVESKLQNFRTEIKDEINTSLQRMLDMFSEYTQKIGDRKVVIETVPQPAVQNIPQAVDTSAAVSEEITTDSADGNKTPEQVHTHLKESLSQTVPAETLQEQKALETEHLGLDDGIFDADKDIISFEPVTETLEPHKKKKKKKKKNREAQVAANTQQSVSEQPLKNVSVTTQERLPERPQQQDRQQIEKKRNTSDIAESPSSLPAFDGTIRNQAYKYEDSFDNVRLDLPPQDTGISDEYETEELSANSDARNIAGEGNSVREEPELTDEQLSEYDFLSDETVPTAFSPDDLDFVLPEDGPVQKNTSENPEISADIVSGGLDDFVSNDDLDFSLPPSIDDNNKDLPQQEMPDALTYSEPTEESLTATVQPENSVASEDPFDNLEAFISNGNDETEDISNGENLDIADTTLLNTETEKETEQERPSRYSAELDKIREALTTDNIDISSLDKPIALDDYSDDENVGEDYYTSTDFTKSSSGSNPVLSQPEESSQNSDGGSAETNDTDWEWEYVDENGNEIPAENEDDTDWEWEYVDENGNKISDDDSFQYEDNQNKTDNNLK